MENKKLKQLTESLTEMIFCMETLEEKVQALNHVRKELHLVSPFKGEPVDLVQWVLNTDVIANDYNPNSVAPPEMKLLETSISEDGYTQPIVTYPRDDIREVVDGFHRHRVGKESEIVSQRIMGYLPVVTIKPSQEGLDNRMASTIRHNRARGKHRVDSMSEIVLELKRRNWSDKKIANNLGMDQDEILRLSVIGGIADMFADQEFSEAWAAETFNDINEEDDLSDNEILTISH